MKTCPKCGSANPEEALFCHACGTKLTPQEAPKTVASTPASWTSYDTLSIVGVVLGVTQIFAPAGLVLGILGITKARKMKPMAIVATALCGIVTIMVIVALIWGIINLSQGGKL